MRSSRTTLSQKTAKIMVFMLIRAASKTWRKLKGANQLPQLIEGIKFIDGVASTDDRQNRAACSTTVTQIRPYLDGERLTTEKTPSQHQKNALARPNGFVAARRKPKIPFLKVSN